MRSERSQVTFLHHSHLLYHSKGLEKMVVWGEISMEVRDVGDRDEQQVELTSALYDTLELETRDTSSVCLRSLPGRKTLTCLMSSYLNNTLINVKVGSRSETSDRSD